MSRGFFWNVKKKKNMALKGFIIKFWDFYIYFYTFLLKNFILYTFIVIQSGTPGWWVGAFILFFSFFGKEVRLLIIMHFFFL